MGPSSELSTQLADWSYQHTLSALAMLDASGTILECNPAFGVACNQLVDTLIGRPIVDALRQPEKSPLVAALLKVQRRGSAQAVMAVPVSDDASTSRQWRFRLVCEPDGKRVFVEGTDLTRESSLSKRLQTTSTRDRLTGLENRDALKDDLADALKTRQPVALFMIDLDRFMLINDTYGHEVGDTILVLVGRRLAQAAGVRNSVARVGGDQFAVMARRLSTPEAVDEMAGRLHQAIAGELTLDRMTVHLRVSIGYSVSFGDRDDANDLLREADTALNRTAELGGNCVQQFRPEFHESMEQRMQTEADLRAALGTPQIDADVQGVFDCATRELLSFEALARWRHPQRGTVGPWGFIDVADRFDLLNDVMAGVLRRSLAGLGAWLLGDRSRRLAVNVAPSQLLNPRLCDTILDELVQTGVLPEQLVVELTENELIAEPAAVAMIERLHDAGMGLAIDDFGAGASSLGYLWTLPVSVLKIDRSLVSCMIEDAAARRTVAALVKLAHDLGLSVVAEGVEEEAELAALIEIGCDKVQGYLLHKPCPMSELGHLIGTGGTGQRQLGELT